MGKGIIGKRIGNYRIDKFLGQGGMAAVYQATDTRLNRQVAIKLMHSHLAAQPAFQARFLQEADAISRLNHPNIIKILGFDRTGSDLYMVTELITGGNLRTYIKRLSEEARLVELPDVVDLMRQLANALDYAHRQGMMHRDIKPDNVLLRPVSPAVSRSGLQPVLTDFGLVRLTASSDTGEQPIGTYPYMSPEQSLGESIDTRTDIYSLGVMLYELAAGRLPFLPRNLPEAARMHGSEPVIPPTSYRPEIDAALEAVIVKCLAKAPDERYQTAGELEAALVALHPPEASVEEDFEPGDLATDTGATVQMGQPLSAEKPLYMPPPPEAEEDSGADRLICYSTEHPVVIVTLHEGVYTIGTADDQTIRLTGNKVSRRHARLERTGGKYRITDSGSINGTWVSTGRLQGGKSSPVEPGQLLRVGDYWLWIDDSAGSSRSREADQDTDHGVAAPPVAAAPVVTPPATPVIVPTPPASFPEPKPAAEKTEAPAPAASELEIKPPEAMAESVAPEAEKPPAPPPDIAPRKVDVTPPPELPVGLPLPPEPPAAPPPARAQADEIGASTTHKAAPPSAADERASSSGIRRAAPPPRAGAASPRAPARQIRVPPGKSLPAAPPPAAEDEEKTGEAAERPPAAAAPAAPPPSRPEKPAEAREEAIDKTIMNLEVPAAPAPQEAQKGLGGISIPDGSLMVGKAVGTFRLMRFIGQNPISAVYEAWDGRRSRAVALKLMHQALSSQEPMRRRFLDEARAASNLDHPNIAKIYSYETADQHTYMVMELITGGSLRGYMRRLRNAGKSLDFLEIAAMVREMADGLHYAHQQGLLHRDIKPENIVLRETTDQDGRTVYHPILTDFGLAQISEGGDIFSTDQPATTYPYMSPEECLAQRTDARSDIYEVGTLMYEMATGQTPFQPRSLAEAIRMHTRDEVPRPSSLRADIPAELERIILKCLQKEPNNRFLTAAELSRAMQNLTAMIVEEIPEEALRGEEAVLETVLMPAPIPEEMPHYTPQPVTDEQVGFERLVVTSEKYPTFALPMNKNVMTVGRAEDQTVRLESATVSMRHARIERGFGNTFRVVDLGSPNGTYLGNKRLVPNVAEVWPLDKTLRIGEYWFKMEPAITQKPVPRGLPTMPQPPGGAAPALVPVMGRQAVSPITNLDDSATYSAEELAAAGIAIAVAPPPVRKVLPPPQHDLIGFKVMNPVVTVAPGSAVVIQLEVQNLSERVDHFAITVEGLPVGWYTVEQKPINLLPNNRETATITIHPPLASSTTEGAHYFEVRTIAREQNIRSVAVQCAANVLPFKNFVTSLEPRRVTARNRPEVTITNTGNTYATFTLQVRDREQAIQYEISGKQFTLGPGQSEYVGMRLKPRERPLLGGERIIPYEVIVSAGDEKLVPQTVNGELAVRARFPIWIISVLMMMLVLCMLLSLFVFTQVQAVIAVNNTATAVVTATKAAVEATATANADPDNDGLTTFQEQALGLKPDDPDTDKDGLIDGDEVTIWNTNPLNPDTDGDGAKDGTEVNELGTDPLKPDSDEDGLPDNEDAAPTIKSTPTLTPFPTLPGTEGDICAGSPLTRLKIGIDAKVEAGGVNNRLRDNPGTATGQVIGLMPPGSGFRVLEGPVCDPEEQLRWWKVDYNGVVGWTAEGRGTEYYLCPPDACGQGGAGGAGGGGTGGGGTTPSGDGTTGSLPPNPEVVANIDAVLQSLPQPVSALGLDRNRMGVQLFKSLDTGSWQVALDRTGNLGVRWIKVQANWAALQTDGPGTLSSVYSTFEANLQSARQRGYRIMVSVAKAPTWARSIQSSESGPPDNPQALADFLTLLLSRVGPLVDAIEIWNEPNLRQEWTSGALPFNGAGYMQLFQPAYQAVRNYSPLIVIVTAGLAPAGNSVVSVDDRAYLMQMYANGLGNFRDIVIGVHPYGWGNPPGVRCCDANPDEGWDDHRNFFFLNTLEDYRTIQLANNHDVALWITEFGWATWADLPGEPPEPWIGYNTLTDQATFTLQAFHIGQRLPYVGPMILWNLNFANSAAVQARDGKAAYSLLIDDTQMRPLFGSLVAPPAQ